MCWRLSLICTCVRYVRARFGLCVVCMVYYLWTNNGKNLPVTNLLVVKSWHPFVSQQVEVTFSLQEEKACNMCVLSSCCVNGLLLMCVSACVCEREREFCDGSSPVPTLWRFSIDIWISPSHTLCDLPSCTASRGCHGNSIKWCWGQDVRLESVCSLSTLCTVWPTQLCSRTALKYTLSGCHGDVMTKWGEVVV